MATKYWMTGGDGSWNTATNWSTVSSAGPNDTTKAVAGDTVILDAGSPNCTNANTNSCTAINGAGYTGTFTSSAALSVSGSVTFDTSGAVTVSLAQTWGSLVLTGYTGTVTINATLTVSGAISLGAGMVSAGTGILRAGATATLTSAGHAWAGAFQLSGTSQTFTLADSWVVGTLATAGGGTQTLNGQTMTAGGLTTNIGLTGSTPITLTGGVWAGSVTMSSSLTLDGDVTLSGTVKYAAVNAGACTLRYNSGTITTTGSTLEIAGTASGVTTLDCAGMTFNAVSLTTNVCLVALTSALTCVTLLFGANTNATFSGTAGWTCDYLMHSSPNSSSIVMTLAQAATYTVTTSMIVQGASLALYRSFNSSSGTDKVPLILEVGAGQDLRYVKAVRVDSSGGQTIHSYGIAAADISTSLNWDIVGGGFMWLG